MRKTLAAVFKRKGRHLSVWIDYGTGKAEVVEGDVPNRPIASALLGDMRPYWKTSEGVVMRFGPAASGLFQAGAFDIETFGEEISSIRPIYDYKGSRILSSMIGRRVEEALVLMERAGGFLVTYAVAFARAVEAETIERTADARRVLLELERLHNHLHSIGELAGDASQKVARMQFAAMEEEVLRAMAELTGHRYGAGAVRVGGFRLRDISALERLRGIEREFPELEDELEDSKTFLDRLHRTCTLKESDVLELDAVGIAAKGSGIPRDVRRFDPYYHGYRPPVEKGGDALARMLVMMEEIKSSMRTTLETDLGDLTSSERGKGRSKRGLHMGVAEGPHGDVVVLVDVKDGRVRWIGVRGASRVNYIAFCRGITGGVFTDFSFGLHSFGLNFADAGLWQGGEVWCG